MNGKIILNLVSTNPLNKFTCREATLKIPSLTPEKNRLFLRYLFRKLKGPLYGFFSRDKVYFLGDKSLWNDLAKELDKKFGIKQASSRIKDASLNFNDNLTKKIVQNILYSVFEDYLKDRGFTVLSGRRRNMAIPTPILQEQKDYPLIHNRRYFEGFSFNIRVSYENRVTLQIDPKINVLIPYEDRNEGDWIVTMCFDTDCENANNCPVIPRNAVIFEGEEVREIEECIEKPIQVGIVYDRKTQERMFIPVKYLYIEPSRGAVPYRVMRTHSLKNPEGRKLYTKRFVDILKIKDNIVLPTELNDIIFSIDFINLNYTASIDAIQEFNGYSVIPQVQAVFGEGLTEVSPFDGLKRHCTYSYNKSPDRRYVHPHIRVFTIYPSVEETFVSRFLTTLENGLFYYLGFKEESNPYRTSISFEKFPIDFEDEINYIERVKARIRNIQEDYPWRIGYLILLPIPRGSERFYDEIKDFCLARKLRTQMIKCENLGLDAYPLYNFSLSIYAKAGGTPWIIEPSYFDLADCYIGQAFARKMVGGSGTEKFFVGAADVFNAWGEHISFALHQSFVDREITGLHVDREFMMELMNKAITRYIDEMDYPPKTLVVHRPGHFIREEIEGVQEVLDKQKIEKCYLVHVQHNNLFRAYDPSMNNQIRRGTYFKIGPRNVVLFPTGYLESEGKEHKMGTPKPVQLNVKSIIQEGKFSLEISNEELYKICKNFLGFTRLRWNSLSTRLREPLPIYASRKVAEWLRKDYRGLEGIDIRDIL